VYSCDLKFINYQCVDCSFDYVVMIDNLSHLLICFGDNGTCGSSISHCLVCYDDSLCLYCVPDRVLYENKCFDCVLGIVNTSSDLGLLNKCYGNDTSCRSSISDCLICYNSTLCLYCRVGRLVNGGCSDVPGCTSVASMSTNYSFINTSVCNSCQQPSF